jgi:hypothetical protein
VWGALRPAEADGGQLAVPTGVINYIDLEAQLWQQAKQDSAEMDLLLSSVNGSVRQMYQQVPFLLDRLGDVRAAVDDAVSRHFDALEEDWSGGDWEAAVAEWASDTSQLDGSGLLDPTVVIGAISDATIVRAPQLLQALESADGTRYADASSEIHSAIGTGPAADGLAGATRAMADLKPGYVLSPTDAADTFGISPQNLADLVRFCKDNGVVVTLRARTTEAIPLVDRGISVVKPAAVKLKTVNQIDLGWLGYPPELNVDGLVATSLGQVLIRQPVFLAGDCPAACAVQKLEDQLQEAGVGRDNPVWYEVVSRWEQRDFEWGSPAEGYVEQLQSEAATGELTLDWHWSENMIDPATTAPPETVGFRMADGPNSTEIPEVCVHWAQITKVCAGVWRSITGDVDLVSVTAADGSPLSDQRYVELLEQLGATSVAVQHASTVTWYKQLNDGTYVFDANDERFPEKAQYMQAGKCCRMQVGADGVARAVLLELQGSTFNNKNDFFLNYIGRELLPAP